MKTAIVPLKGIATYQQNRAYEVDKLPKELPNDYEKRTWRNRAHVNSAGNVFIPPMAFKYALDEAIRRLGLQIPGRARATYTKHFEAGVLVIEPLVLPVKVDAVEGTWLFVPSDGVRGGGKRVQKCFPTIHEWEGRVRFLIFDDIITEEVFTQGVIAAGQLIGIGLFRPEHRGYNGRFVVNGKIEWEENGEIVSSA